MKADAKDTPWPTRNDGDTTGPPPGLVSLVANAGESRSSNRLSLRIIAHLQCGQHQIPYQSTYRSFVRLVGHDSSFVLLEMQIKHQSCDLFSGKGLGAGWELVSTLRGKSLPNLSS